MCFIVVGTLQLGVTESLTTNTPGVSVLPPYQGKLTNIVILKLKFQFYALHVLVIAVRIGQ